MAYEALTAGEVDVGSPVSSSLLTKIKDNLDYLYGAMEFAQTGLLNGSFEIDSDHDGKPDNWEIQVYPGGTVQLYQANVLHGQNSLAFVHPGGASNGGGAAISNPVMLNSHVPLTVGWSYLTSAAGMKCIVTAHWYDAAMSYLAGTTLYSSTANPASWTTLTQRIPMYAGAKYLRLAFTMGYTDTDVAGTALLDDVRLYQDLAAVPVGGASRDVGNGTSYCTPYGEAAGDSEYAMIMSCAGLWRNLRQISNQNVVLTFRRNGNDTSLSVSGTAVDSSHIVAVAAGDRVSLKRVSGQGEVYSAWGLEFLPACTG